MNENIYCLNQNKNKKTQIWMLQRQIWIMQQHKSENLIHTKHTWWSDAVKSNKLTKDKKFSLFFCCKIIQAF